jgi:hypothetical protein
MHRFFQMLVLLALTTTLVKAQPTSGTGQLLDDDFRVISTAVPFMIIAPDARSAALGDAGVALSPSANSMHWNASQLAFIQDDFGFSLSYTPWLGSLGISDMSISYLSGYYKISREQTLGVALRYFDLGGIIFTQTGIDQVEYNPKEYALEVAYARKLAENFSLSITGKGVISDIIGGQDDAGPAIGIAADVSAYYTQDMFVGGNNSNLSFGMVISNIGNRMSYTDEAQAVFQPTNLRLGTALKTELDPYNSFTFLVDFNKLMVPSPPIRSVDGTIISGRDPARPMINGMFGSFIDAPGGFREELNEVTIGIGTEYWYDNVFAVRAGYFYEHFSKGDRKYFTVGLGFRYQVFGLDFAYLVPQRQQHPLAETLRISLNFNFFKGKEADTIAD